MIEFLYLSGVVFFIFLEGFFSSLETAFVCTEYFKITALRERRPKIYSYLNRFLKKPERFLSTTLVGTNLCIITGSSLATFMLVKAGIENSSFWVSLALTPAVLLFGEMFPKNVGRVFEEKLIIYSLTPFRFFELILRPLVLGVGFLPSKIVALFFKKAKPILNKDDIKILTETLHSQGSLERIEKEAIVDALGFSQTRVKDVSVELKKVVGIDYIDNVDTILNKARDFGFTRYPVFKNKHIIGYINIFDLFYRDFISWQDLIRPIFKVGINQRLDDILALLRLRKENIALVFKGKRPYGIVSTQDLVREIISSLTRG
ncbi:MAG: DUF21 domain-containing protein [Candidatus Omnitrophica bacterium]|nr:DUF21 domain-containing protein [Candidatus Omnitrophota bacterium]